MKYFLFWNAVVEVGFPSALVRVNSKTKSFYVCLQIVNGKLDPELYISTYYKVRNKDGKIIVVSTIGVHS